MTLTQFVQKYNGKGVDFDGSYGNQCVDLFRQYNKEVLTISQPKGVQGAADFWANYETDPNLKNNFTKVANTPTGVPKAGDVMIWTRKYGPYGHIAIVTKADTDSFTCFSQNDPTGSLCGLKTYKYVNVYGWFSPIVKATQESMPEEIQVSKKVFEELVTKSTKYDELLPASQKDAASLADARTQISDLKSQLSGAKTALKSEQTKRQDFIDVVADIVKSLATEASVIEFLTTDSNARAGLIADKAKLEKQIETVKAANADEIALLKQQVADAKLVIQDLTKKLGIMETRIEELEKTKTVESGFWKAINDLISKIKGMK